MHLQSPPLSFLLLRTWFWWLLVELVCIKPAVESMPLEHRKKRDARTLEVGTQAEVLKLLLVSWTSMWLMQN